MRSKNEKEPAQDTVVVIPSTCKGFELRCGYTDTAKELLLYVGVKVEYIKSSQVEDFINQIRRQ